MPQTNEDLQKDVLNAIKWEPLLNVGEVAVTGKDGLIALTGGVDNYPTKLEMETAAKNAIIHIQGVRGVNNEIKLKSETTDEVEKTAIE